MHTVVVRSVGGLRQQVTAGDHIVVADEPISAGGSDAGADPYSLLLGALGSCKAMTLLLYSQRKGWDLTGVEVRLTHSREYARDCQDCDEKSARIDRITVGLSLSGNLDESQKARLEDIAERCPVHQSLSGHIQIVRAEQ